MFTKFLLVQKIEESGNAMFYVMRSEYLRWIFENRREKSESDPVFFPFIIETDGVAINEHSPGPETEISLMGDEISFKDDYAVEKGTTIAILFPKNFVLDVLKFKDKPAIPVGLPGQFMTNAQGQFQILYSQVFKSCAIVFNIHENVVFGFKCIVKKVLDENFPQNESINGSDFFDVIIDTDLLKIDAITNDDLKVINDTLNGQASLDDVKDAINEVLIALKSKNKIAAKSGFDKLSKHLVNGASLVGNLTKIIDSYNDKGAPFLFIGKLLKLISLDL